MKSKLVNHWGAFPAWLRFLIIVILLIGIFFRCVNLERKVYWHDEVHTSIRSFGYTQKEIVNQVFDGHVIGIEDLQKYQRFSPEKSLSDSIHALVQNPEHPPLYYLLVRFWMQLFGNFFKTPRGLSVLFSLLALPCMYWLCLELFNSRIVGWIAVALVSVSPFHILYAQEAREYSLGIVTILLSNVTFLRAMRLKTKVSWGVYAIALALSFYTFLFSGFVAIGHGIYVFLLKKNRERATDNSELTIPKSQGLYPTVKAYFLATGIGLLFFSPWLFVIITNFSQVKEKTAWANVPENFYFLTKIWRLHVSALFVDFGLDVEHQFNNFAPLILLIMVGYAIYLLCSYTPKKIWWFVVTLMGVTAIALILPDIILGGRRSMLSRYFIPCYLGIQLAVAYLLATQLSSASSSNRKLWQGIMAVLISLGIISCTISSQSYTWWNKTVGYFNPTIAGLINKAQHPLIISNTSDINLGDIISLSYLLAPKVKFQLVVDPKIPKIPDGFSDVFLFYPSQFLQQGIKKEYNAKLEPIFKVGIVRLWKLVRENHMGFEPEEKELRNQTILMF